MTSGLETPSLNQLSYEARLSPRYGQNNNFVTLSVTHAKNRVITQVKFLLGSQGGILERDPECIPGGIPIEKSQQIEIFSEMLVVGWDPGWEWDPRVGMGSQVEMGSQVGSHLGMSGSGILHLVSLFKAEDTRWNAILHELKSPQQGQLLRLSKYKVYVRLN